ncbi:MAG: dihydroorotase [Bryobacterales bacterium]|nr:dihydroorotase [Bryobacterales bacterium]
MRPLLFFLFAAALPAQTYDIVIANGRVIDPETNLDAVRWVGIDHGTIRAVSTKALHGRATIDAKGLVVAPGFIDLHEHGQDPEAYTFQARDGVTSTFELEVGTADVARWYAEREGKSLINHGVSIGHIQIRMKVMKDPADFVPSGPGAHQVATPEQISEMKQLMERGFKEGAVAAGLGPTYTPAATRWEILEMFRVAARFKASCHVHLRGNAESGEPEEGLEEVLAASAVTGAPLQVVHINSSSLSHAPHMLQMIAEARSHGIDVTTEMYPYIAGQTRLDSARFDNWVDRPEADYHNIMWVATGERLTKESFQRYRKQGGLAIIFNNTEDMIDLILRDPLPMIATDGFGYEAGNSHPRSAGSHSRILGVYVRERHVISLDEAIRKMTLMPARRLEARVPAMKRKGRVQVGADADINVFDPETIHDRSTYKNGKVPSEGVRYLLVNGTFVVRDGKLVNGVAPGEAIRAPLR